MWTAKNLWLDTFPDTFGHFRAPWWTLWIFFSNKPDIIRLNLIILPILTWLNNPAKQNRGKNANHEMALVGEPCNVNSHANIPALFKTMLCPWLCVHMYCTHWLWLYSCLINQSEHRIHPEDTTYTHTTQHTYRVKCWAQVPRLKKPFMHGRLHYLLD